MKFAWTPEDLPVRSFASSQARFQASHALIFKQAEPAYRLHADLTSHPLTLLAPASTPGSWR